MNADQREQHAEQCATFAEARAERVARAGTDHVGDANQEREPQVLRLRKAEHLVRVEISAALQQRAGKASRKDREQEAPLECHADSPSAFLGTKAIADQTSRPVARNTTG